MKLTVPQIAGYARAAGFTGSSLEMMCAIVLAESGGETTARGDVALNGPTCASYGLSQIYVCPNTGNGRSWVDKREALFDPATNLKVAWEMSNGGKNFRPWSTYNNGSAQRMLSTVHDALLVAGGPTLEVREVTTTTAGAEGGGLVGDLSGLARLGALLADPKTWLRVATVGIGVGLGILGLMLINRDTLNKAVGTLTGNAPAKEPAPETEPTSSTSSIEGD